MKSVFGWSVRSTWWRRRASTTSYRSAVRLRTVFTVLLAEYLVMAAVAVGGYLAHSLVPQSLIDSVAEELEKVTGPLSIFLHNLPIMTVMWLPFVGPMMAAVSITATGFLLGALVAHAKLGYLELALAYACAVFMPHGLLELSACAFAIASSLEFTRSILSRRASRAVVRAWLASYAVALVLLLAAAYVEWYEIQILTPSLESVLK